MKRKVNISYLLIRLGLILLPVFTPQLLSAQEDSTRIARDSMRAQPEGKQLLSLPDLLPARATELPLLEPGYSGSLLEFSPEERLRLPYQTNPSPLFQGDYRTSGVLKQFNRGVLFGSGAQTSLPGLGRINDASLGYRYAFNERLSMQLGVNAMKTNLIHSTGQAFGTSGSLSYRASDRVAFTVFGSYDIGNSYGMSTNRYGGTVSFNVSDRFEMEVGVQRYYDTMRGRWETVPIVIPTYDFGKFKLGLDVGGVLYEILRSTVFGGSDSGSSGPTIAPPRFSLPIR